MSWIIMGIDECGSEFRPNDVDYLREADALDALPEVRKDYPEARSMWVEQLRDKDYYMSQFDLDEQY